MKIAHIADTHIRNLKYHYECLFAVEITNIGNILELICINYQL